MSEDDYESGPDAFLDKVNRFLESSREETLSEALARRESELGISETQAARLIGLGSTNTLRRIKSGDSQSISVVVAMQMAQYLGLSLDQVARLHVNGLDSRADEALRQTAARMFIAKHFDLKGLRSIGFIEDDKDFEAVEDRIVSFFGLDDVFEYGAEVSIPLFMQRRISFKDQMRSFWVSATHYKFRLHPNPYPYERDQLLALLPQIRQYTRFTETGLLTVVRALYRAGVTVLVQSYVSGTAVKGATFVVDGRPCIVLTDLGKKYPEMWFALLHELAHVLYDWDQLQRVSFHLSGEADTLLVEDRADYVAAELLVPSDKLDYAEPHLDNPHFVHQYAKQIDVHPSLVYWLCARRRYKETGEGDLFAFHSREINVEAASALDQLRHDNWNRTTISDGLGEVIETIS